MKTQNKNTSAKQTALTPEESYRLAKLIRAGKRELDRQYNIKKARRQR